MVWRAGLGRADGTRRRPSAASSRPECGERGLLGAPLRRGKLPESREEPLRLSDDEGAAVPDGHRRRDVDAGRRRFPASPGIALGDSAPPRRARAGDRTERARGIPRAADELSQVHQRRCEVARSPGGTRGPSLPLGRAPPDLATVRRLRPRCPGSRRPATARASRSPRRRARSFRTRATRPPPPCTRRSPAARAAFRRSRGKRPPWSRRIVRAARCRLRARA